MISKCCLQMTSKLHIIGDMLLIKTKVLGIYNMHETFDVSIPRANNDDNVPRIGKREVVPSPDVVNGSRLFPDDPLLIREGRRTCVVVDNATVNDPTNLQSLLKFTYFKSNTEH